MEPILDGFGFLVAKAGLPPVAWTALGVICAAGSAFFYSGLYVMNAFLGGLLLLISGLLDVVDGAVARATGASSASGSFIDSTLDRVSEVLVYAGIAIGALANAWIVLLALSFSLLVSYVRAKAESVGVQLAGVGLGERAERIVVLAVLSMAGLVEYGVAAVAVLAGATFLQRFVAVARALAAH